MVGKGVKEFGAVNGIYLIYLFLDFFFPVIGENNLFTLTTWDLSSLPATPPFLDVVGRSRVILCDWEMEMVVWGVSESFPICSGSRNTIWSIFSVPLSCIYTCCSMRVFTVLEKCPCLCGSQFRKDIRRFVCLFAFSVCSFLCLSH